jgi:hypothetical protein
LLISIPVKKVLKWCEEELGETLQSKKKIAYSDARKGTKVDLICNAEN